MFGHIVGLILGSSLIAFVVWHIKRPDNPLANAWDIWLGYWGLSKKRRAAYKIMALALLGAGGVFFIIVGLIAITRRIIGA